MFSQITKSIVRQFFTYGNTLDVCELFTRFMDIPEVRHLTQMGSDDFHSVQLRATVDIMMRNMSDDLTKILATKGTRTTIDQQAYRTVVAACSGPKLRDNKLMGNACRILVHFSWVCVTA